MNRRKILTLSVIAALAMPLSVCATDYRASNAKAWTAKTVKSAIQSLYGDIHLTKSDAIDLKMPKVTSNGGAVPVGISTAIEAKSVALFQDSNPESAVAVWAVPEGGIIDYRVKLKLKTLESGLPSRVIVVVEGKDGKYYSTHASVKVAGGCEG